MTDSEKLAIAIDALKEIASQECNLRQGGCVPVLDFEGLEMASLQQRMRRITRFDALWRLTLEVTG